MNDGEPANQAIHELLTKREAQLKTATLILKPLTIVAAVVVFALCFWRYEMGLLLSVGVAILTFPAMGLGVALPVGYFLGRNAARRLKRKLEI